MTALTPCATCAQAAATIARLTGKLDETRRSRCSLDCRYTMGDVSDFSGSHCPPDRTCERCEAERLSDRLTAERDEVFAAYDAEAAEADRLRAALAAARESGCRWRDYHGDRPLNPPKAWVLWREGRGPMGVIGEGPFVHPNERAWWVALPLPGEEGGDE